MHLFVACRLYIWLQYLLSTHYYLKHGISGLPVQYTVQVFCKLPVKFIKAIKLYKNCSKEKQNSEMVLSCCSFQKLCCDLWHRANSTMQLSVTHHLTFSMILVCTGKTKGTQMKGRLTDVHWATCALVLRLRYEWKRNKETKDIKIFGIRSQNVIATQVMALGMWKITEISLSEATGCSCWSF